MKKIILSAISLFVAVTTFAQANNYYYAASLVLATNFTGAPAGNTFLLRTNRTNVKQIEISTGVASGATFTIYDSGNLSAAGATPGTYGTSNVVASYTNRLYYTTNLVNTFIGSNGYTNYTTNQGIFTYNNVVAASTNALVPDGVWTVAGAAYAVYNTDILLNNGLVCTINTNASVVIYYNTGGL